MDHMKELFIADEIVRLQDLFVAIISREFEDVLRPRPLVWKERQRRVLTQWRMYKFVSGAERFQGTSAARQSRDTLRKLILTILRELRRRGIDTVHC